MADRASAVILLALATWRIASLIARERGPYAILERFRNRFMDKTEVWQGDVKIGYEYVARSEFAQLITCPWCSSLWIATAATILYTCVYGFDVWVVALPFGISTLAILLDRMIG